MTHRAIQFVPIDQIVLAPQLRKRVKIADIKRMAATIKSCGVIHPGRVRQADGKFELVVGALRFLGAKEAALSTFPVEIADKLLTRAEIIKLQYVENETRVALNPMEEARGVCEFQAETGLKGIEIAAELGIDDTRVSRCRERVNDWCTELQELVESGKVPASTGHRIHKIACPEEKEKAIREAAAGEMTRDEADAVAKRRRKRPQSDKPIERIAQQEVHRIQRQNSRTVRQFKANVADTLVTVRSKKTLTRASVIAMIEALLAHLHESALSEIDEDAFFTTPHEVQVATVAADV